MASEEVNNYITKRYSKWLDYSSYQCTRAGIPNESLDVLNANPYVHSSKTTRIIIRIT